MACPVACTELRAPTLDPGPAAYLPPAASHMPGQMPVIGEVVIPVRHRVPLVIKAQPVLVAVQGRHTRLM